ncbi:MAG TPA: TlpA disulfide reductase family protein [Bryobacteraceae bacterium]|jgi:thiol-disulfide isomerase/thioredoxin|nr:TlpA disulfide reductase family protein [Bryobacteraceae bacterium]
MRLIQYFAIVLAVSGMAHARSISGLWDGTVKYDDYKIPFLFEFSQKGEAVSAAFFNGDEQISSTGGSLIAGALNVNFDQYAMRLKATYKDGLIKGTYGNASRGFHDFEACPHRNVAASAGTTPNIAGVWIIPNESPKGEHAWRLIVQQRRAHVSAAILRVDGDTGALVGDFKDGKWVLNHFDGARASVADVTPKAGGSLDIEFRSGKSQPRRYTAVRADQAKAEGLPEPTDPDEQTRVQDPNEPLRFSFRDLSGKLVSNSDPQFRSKVVLVNVTGSWCPNCHDEAPFLVDLYRRYHSQGLEIVALDFEEPEQLEDPTRLQAFIKKYGIEYTYLLAGEPSELHEKLPQAVNLNSWPTTFFLGRDGRVRAIHAGFAAPASGDFNETLKKETNERIEKLLAENMRASR